MKEISYKKFSEDTKKYKTVVKEIHVKRGFTDGHTLHFANEGHYDGRKHSDL